MLNQNEEIWESYVDMDIVVMGDFNVLRDKNLDRQRSNEQNVVNNNFRDRLEEGMEIFGLVDIRRLRNQLKKEYTWRRNKTASRLDLILVNDAMCKKVVESKIESIALSDHRIVSCDLDLNRVKRGPGFWRFNNALLEDEDYVEMMLEMLVTEVGRIDEDGAYISADIWVYISCSTTRGRVTRSLRSHVCGAYNCHYSVDAQTKRTWVGSPSRKKAQVVGKRKKSVWIYSVQLVEGDTCVREGNIVSSCPLVLKRCRPVQWQASLMKNENWLCWATTKKYLKRTAWSMCHLWNHRLNYCLIR